MPPIALNGTDANDSQSSAVLLRRAGRMAGHDPLAETGVEDERHAEHQTQP